MEWEALVSTLAAATTVLPVVASLVRKWLRREHEIQRIESVVRRTTGRDPRGEEGIGG
ncbi:hypothetical protein ACFW81_22850 [Streptomyces angustmyceticus]|uniref:hypothetical protein n=1 Tax=Streptomyces angustmyceticus TaxID=285578 RepID=UPI0021AEA4CB|nr:hypothetical protein [Streptomyces angustmyceticus]